jgi:outer membrane protein assembly factor BamD (BamD/ComL family)
MHELEINYFLEGLKYIKNKFFIDAIEQFKKLVREFPDSELADDAEYNISLCYYELNQFDSAITNLKQLIINYPNATITVLGAGHEFGRTAAKSYLLMINCYLALGEIEETSEILSLMEPYNDSYIVYDGERVTYYDLAKRTINIFNKLQMKKEV